MLIFKRLLLGVLIMSVIAATAVAQEAPDVWKFAASVIGEGTDNRDSTPEGEDNFDLFLNLKLEMNMDWESSLIDLYYSPAYRFRSDPSSLQNDTELQHDLGIIARRETGKMNLRFKERFAYTDDPAIQQAGSTLRRDSSYALNDIMAGARVLLTQVSDVDISVNNMIKRYDDDSRSVESDEDSTGAELSFWRRMDTTLSGYLMAGTSAFDYDNTTVDRGFSSVHAGVGMEKSFSRELRGGVRAGYKSLSYDDSTIEDDSSPFIQLSLMTKMSAISRITGVLGYTLRDSDIYPFSSQEATTFSVKWDWDTTPLLELGAYVLYRIGKYDAETVPAGVEETTTITDGDETTFVLQGSATYKINEMTSIFISQRYEDIDSEVTGSTSYTRNSTRVGLNRQF